MSEVKELHREILKAMFGGNFKFNIVSRNENEFKFQIKSLRGKGENNWIDIILKDRPRHKYKSVYIENELGRKIFLGIYFLEDTEQEGFVPNDNFWKIMHYFHLK